VEQAVAKCHREEISEKFMESALENKQTGSGRGVRLPGFFLGSAGAPAWRGMNTPVPVHWFVRELHGCRMQLAEDNRGMVWAQAVSTPTSDFHGNSN